MFSPNCSTFLCLPVAETQKSAEMAQLSSPAVLSQLCYGVGDGLLIAGCGGVAVEDGAQLPKPVPACCRAAVPTPLRMARPIAAWSNVIGPSDSATYPSRSYLCEETIGLRCFVITSGDGIFPRSTERVIAGMKAAAISNIGRSEALSREYSSAVSTYEKKFVGAGSNRSAAL